MAVLELQTLHAVVQVLRSEAVRPGLGSASHAEASSAAASGVPEEERTAERVAACEAALAPALSTTFTASVRAAQRAKAAGATVGIISNHLVSPPLFEYCADGAGLRALVSDPTLLVVSQAVGLGKPDPAIYRLFFQRLRALFSRPDT